MCAESLPPSLLLDILLCVSMHDIVYLSSFTPLCCVQLRSCTVLCHSVHFVLAGSPTGRMKKEGRLGGTGGE